MTNTISGITIAVDCMGGDHCVSVTVPASLQFLSANPQARIVWVGLQEILHPYVQALPSSLQARVDIVYAQEVVAMDESPSAALKNRKQSSMRLAIEAVKNNQAQAVVSSGNTGALMAIARFVLRTIDGIERPAIATVMPSIKPQGTYMLDLGANVDSSAEHLLQFALMGSALVSAIECVERPSIGLLNIGEELIKGNEVVKQAAELMRQAHEDKLINFYGNVEGDDIFKATTDVVVCDGFVGNVALKTSEGLAQFVSHSLKAAFKQNLWSRLAGLIAMPVLKRFKQSMDHRRYNGACLLGLNGIVFKSHGSADTYAFQCALQRAYEAASHGLIERLKQSMPKAPATVSLVNSQEAGQ
jgi:phosphate acyltransferase